MTNHNKEKDAPKKMKRKTKKRSMEEYYAMVNVNTWARTGLVSYKTAYEMSKLTGKAMDRVYHAALKEMRESQQKARDKKAKRLQAYVTTPEYLYTTLAGATMGVEKAESACVAAKEFKEKKAREATAAEEQYDDSVAHVAAAKARVAKAKQEYDDVKKKAKAEKEAKKAKYEAAKKQLIEGCGEEYVMSLIENDLDLEEELEIHLEIIWRLSIRCRLTRMEKEMNKDKQVDGQGWARMEKEKRKCEC